MVRVPFSLRFISSVGRVNTPVPRAAMSKSASPVRLAMFLLTRASATCARTTSTSRIMSANRVGGAASAVQFSTTSCSVTAASVTQLSASALADASAIAASASTLWMARAPSVQPIVRSVSLRLSLTRKPPVYSVMRTTL